MPNKRSLQGKLDHEKRRCRAQAKARTIENGEGPRQYAANRCKRYAVPGGLVCTAHGGKAPQVAAKARDRLLWAADPAAAVLADLLKSDDENIRLRAATALLDRSGHGASATQVQVDGGKVRYEIDGVDLSAL